MTDHAAAAALAVRPAPAALAEVGIAGELVAHVVAELPALAVLDQRDRLLAAAWLASLRSAQTRRASPPIFSPGVRGWPNADSNQARRSCPCLTRSAGRVASGPAATPATSGTCKIASSALFLDEISRRNSYAEYTDISVE